VKVIPRARDLNLGTPEYEAKCCPSDFGIMIDFIAYFSVSWALIIAETE
jgi:hypothetical protein